MKFSSLAPDKECFSAMIVCNLKRLLFRRNHLIRKNPISEDLNFNRYALKARDYEIGWETQPWSKRSGQYERAHMCVQGFWWVVLHYPGLVWCNVNHQNALHLNPVEQMRKEIQRRQVTDQDSYTDPQSIQWFNQWIFVSGLKPVQVVVWSGS